MLFLDSDIHFNPNDVLDLVLRDYELSGAPYPKKSISRKNVALAVQKHLDPAELANVIGDFVFNTAHGTTLPCLIGRSQTQTASRCPLYCTDQYPKSGWPPLHRSGVHCTVLWKSAIKAAYLILLLSGWPYSPFSFPLGGRRNIFSSKYEANFGVKIKK